MSKEKDVKFLKDFSKITISKACVDEKVRMENVYRKKASSEKIYNVKENIKNQLLKLIEVDNETDSL